LFLLLLAYVVSGEKRIVTVEEKGVFNIFFINILIEYIDKSHYDDFSFRYASSVKRKERRKMSLDDQHGIELAQVSLALTPFSIYKSLSFCIIIHICIFDIVNHVSL
jgi:hypothetical protein